MNFRQAAIAVVIFGLASSGCGTICNFAGMYTDPDNQPTIYGGVTKDLECWDDVLNRPASSEQQIGNDPRTGLVLLGLAMADVPVSGIADTLTLPITIYVQHKRIVADRVEGTIVATNQLRPIATLGAPLPAESGQPATGNHQ